MFTINDDKSIHLTRGDIAVIEIGAVSIDGEDYIFKVGDVVRLSVVERNRYDSVVLSKDVIAEAETPTVEMNLTSDDTRIGEVIHKPKDYWYEIEINPDTSPQTIVGHDSSGPKIFRLYPEGDDE